MDYRSGMTSVLTKSHPIPLLGTAQSQRFASPPSTMLAIATLVDKAKASPEATLLGGGTLSLLLVALAHRWITRPKLQGRDKDGNVVPLRTLPMPQSTLPILGNLLDYVNNRHRILHWTTDRSIEFNNEPWIRKLPGQPALITITSPEAIEEITTTQFDNFEKGEFQRAILTEAIGRGLVASDGERWFHQRKVANNFFSARSLRAFMNKSMQKNMEQMYAVLENGIRDDASVELQMLFHEFTLQTFVEMGLGVELKWIGAEEAHPFAVAVDAAARLLVHRFHRPQWFWKLQRWLRVGAEGEFLGHSKTIRWWMDGVVKQSVADSLQKTNRDRSRGSDEMKSVVELFAENSEEDVEGIRPEDMTDFLLTFVLAARDTTALTLSWLFYELGQHSHVVEKIRGEMKSHLPNVERDTYLTTDHTRSLVYLEATLKEVLRLHPAAPTSMKQAVRDTVICGDVPVYKGQIMLMSAFATGRNPKVWGPDANEFKPERWIDPRTNELRTVSAFKLFTFHAGPRTCIGMNLAMLELRLVAANLLHRYRFDVDPSNDGSYFTTITLMMDKPLFARVHAV